MKPLFYTLVLVIPCLAGVALLWGGAWAWATPVLVFVLIPLLELVFPVPAQNDPEQAERAALQGWRFDAAIYAGVAAHFGLLGLYLSGMAYNAWTTSEFAGLTISMGISCGGLAINLGHELGHRRQAFDQILAKILLSTSLYVHFFVEHNRGHHARIGTPDDPASARRGEWLYAFWVRSLWGGWVHAWQLEAERLTRRGRKALSLGNEVLRWQLLQVGLLVAIGQGLGATALLGFVLASCMGVLLLETVNYLEHYGLARRRRADGRWEPVRPVHSWNYNGVLGRLLLFELTRHSDHHAHPKRPFEALRHWEEAPQLPTGYPGMIVAALVPPFFFALMDPRLPDLGGDIPLAKAA